MVETRTCPRCSSWFATEQVDGEFSGICPRCLAGFMMSDPGAGGDVQISSGSAWPAAPKPPDAPLRPGERFAGFEILDVLGHGGMGIVYRARQTSLARTVALKVLAPRIAGSEDFARRFDHEAKVLATLNHPNVVQVHDFGRAGDVHYLVMEHVDGESLETALKRARPDPSWLLRVVGDVACGLRRVHAAGLVHRDLKPANILIASDGTAKIGDFGLAVERQSAQRLTEQGYFVGTPHYVSPEHARGEKVDGRADLYALGVILFEGFAGRPPFQAASPTAVLVKHIEESAPPLRRVAPQAPEDVSEIVRRLLEKDPAKRFATADELERALILASGALLRKAPRRWPPVVAAAALLFGLLTWALWPKAAGTDPVPSLLLSAVEALRVDEYDGAEEAATEARTRGGRETAWAAQIESIAGRAAALRIEHAALRAAGKTDDEEFGQFLCFSKGDWDRGLPMIAAGEDSPYRALAQKDLARPADAAGRIAVAEGWMDLAGREAKPRWAERMRERAWAWLSAARGLATAEQRDTIDPRLAELDSRLECRREIDLLRLANPKKFAVAGEFKVEERRLRTPSSTGLARMALPYLPPDEYDLEIVAERRTGEGALYVGLPRLRGAAGLEIEGRRLPPGKSVRLAIAVRGDRVEATADGATVYSGNGAGPNERWSVPENRLLVIGSEASAFSVSKFSLKSALSLGLEEPFIDLLRLIDPGKDAVRGAWRLGSGLLTSPRPFGIDDLLQIPYAPPDEYDLRAVIERVDGPDGFGIGLVGGGRPFMLSLDSHHGTATGLSLVDGREANANQTTYKGRLFKDRQPLSVHVSVRKNRLEVTADGRPIIRWNADYARCTQRIPWILPNPDAISLCALRSAWRIHKLSVTELSGRGQLLSLRADTPGAPIDLLAVIDPDRDAVVGRFQRTPGGLLTPAGQVRSRLQVPYAPPAEYNLRLVVERKSGTNSLNLGPSWGARPFTIVIDGHGPQQADVTGLDFIDGKEFFRNETTRQGPYLRTGTARVVELAVRLDSIALSVDGQSLFEWKGHASRLSVADGWKAPDPEAILIGSYDSSFEIRELTLIPRRAGGRPLGKAAASLDLLRLTDPARHVVEGAWQMERGALVSAPAFSSITIPYEPPEEYDLHLGVEREVKDEAVVVILPVGAGRQVAVTFDSFGKTSGLDSIDGRGMGFTEREGKVLTTNREHEVRCSVRREGVKVEVSGQTIIDWKGDLSRLSAPAHLKIPEPRGFYLATWTTCRFSRLSLVEVGGRGRPLGAAVPPSGPGIDLLKLVDLDRDRVGGFWSREGAAVVSDRTKFARLEIPYGPPAEYDLRVVFERVDGLSDVNQILAAGGKQFVWVLGAGNSRYGFGMVNGDWIGSAKNPTLGDAPGYAVGEIHESVVKVRRDGVKCFVDGRLLLEHRTDYSNFSMADGWRLRRSSALGLGTYESPTRFHRVEIVEVTGTGRSLNLTQSLGPALTEAREGFKDLLSLIDPKLDTASGTWTMKDGRLHSDDAERAKLEIPYVPPTEYDFRVVFSRVRGISDVNQILSKSGRPFAWCMGGMGNTWSGFGSIKDVWAPERGNPSRIRMTLDAEVTYESVVQVRDTGMKAFVNGALVCEWKTDYKDMDLQGAWQLRDDRLLGLGTFHSPTAFHRVEIREVTGLGRRLR